MGNNVQVKIHKYRLNHSPINNFVIETNSEEGKTYSYFYSKNKGRSQTELNAFKNIILPFLDINFKGREIDFYIQGDITSISKLLKLKKEDDDENIDKIFNFQGNESAINNVKGIINDIKEKGIIISKLKGFNIGYNKNEPNKIGALSSNLKRLKDINVTLEEDQKNTDKIVYSIVNEKNKLKTTIDKSEIEIKNKVDRKKKPILNKNKTITITRLSNISDKKQMILFETKKSKNAETKSFLYNISNDKNYNEALSDIRNKINTSDHIIFVEKNEIKNELFSFLNDIDMERFVFKERDEQEILNINKKFPVLKKIDENLPFRLNLNELKIKEEKKAIYFEKTIEDEKSVGYTIIVFDQDKKKRKKYGVSFIINKNNVNNKNNLEFIVRKAFTSKGGVNARNLSKVLFKSKIENDKITEDVLTVVRDVLNVRKDDDKSDKLIPSHVEDVLMEKRGNTVREFNRKAKYLSEDIQPDKDSLYVYTDASLKEKLNKKRSPEQAIMAYGILLRKPMSDNVLMTINGLKTGKAYHNNNSTNAEESALQIAISKLLKLKHEKKIPDNIKNIDIKFDNLNTVMRVDESDKVVDKKLLDDLKELKKHYNVRVRWIEGHVKNVFNEYADKLAEDAYKMLKNERSNNVCVSKTDIIEKDWFNQKKELKNKIKL